MIKLKATILSQLADAGYTPARLRREKLLSESTIQKLRNHDSDVTLRTCGMIAYLLGTTDIFTDDWRGDKK